VRAEIWREKVFVTDKTKVASRVGHDVKLGVWYVGELLTESNEKKISLIMVLRVWKFAVIEEEMFWRAFWRRVMLKSKLGGWKERKSWVSSVVVEGKHSSHASQRSWSRHTIPNKHGRRRYCGCWLQQNDVKMTSLDRPSRTAACGHVCWWKIC